MHNQNDVGNFVVHFNGETLIPDVGRGRYTRAYFGPQRYSFFVNSSRGHSVPRPNGQEQLPGEQYAAALLDHRSDASGDSMTIELKGAYPPEADLATLKRTVALHRDAPRGWVEVVDTVGFATQPGQCESVITTFVPVEIGPSAAIIRGEKGAPRDVRPGHRDRTRRGRERCGSGARRGGRELPDLCVQRAGARGDDPTEDRAGVGESESDEHVYDL